MAGTEPHVWGTGRMDDITYVGLDVHKATVCVAVAESGPSGEVRQVRVFENRPEILCKIAARLSKGGRRLSGGGDHGRGRSGRLPSFANARQLMAYLGLVPSEHSSGSTIRRGGITKAGNALARRVLIEGAWTYRMTARVSRKLHDRLEPLSGVIRDIAWKAQVRLCARYRRLAAAGKPKVVVTTAIAREMVGFIWAIARMPAGARLTELPTERANAGGRAQQI